MEVTGKFQKQNMTPIFLQQYKDKNTDMNIFMEEESRHLLGNDQWNPGID